MTDITNIIEANRQTTLRNIKLYAPQLVQLIDEADEADSNVITINRTMADDILAMFTSFETAVREIKWLIAEVEKMKPVYYEAVFLADPTMLLSLSRYTNNGASVVNTVAIERLANAVRVSMEIDHKTYKKELES